MSLRTKAKQPAKDEDADRPVVEIGEQMYQASCWGSNDGKFGAGVKIWVTPLNGEELSETLKRGNRMAVHAQRELLELMGEK